MNTWPDGAMTRSAARRTPIGGAFRVPLAVALAGRIPAGVVTNDIVQHHDWLPTSRHGGEPDISGKLAQGSRRAAGSSRCTSTAKPAAVLTEKGTPSPRRGFITSTMTATVAVRFGN